MGKKRPVKILTLDTETLGLEGALKRIAIYDGVKVSDGYIFGDIQHVIEHYYSMGFMPHIYIHNADFDLRKLPEVFELGNVVWSMTKKIGGKFAKVTCRHYVIHDSYKILNKSLAKLSQDFELEHGKLDLWEEVQRVYPNQYTDHVDFMIRCDKDDPIYVKYLHFDVISLYELLDKLCELAKLDHEQLIHILSTASLSRYLFKNGYGGMQFKNPRSEQTDFDILTRNRSWGSEKKMKEADITYLECEYVMRSGFYGGRTEVFTVHCPERKGVDGNREITAYHYDVNSLY